MMREVRLPDNEMTRMIGDRSGDDFDGLEMGSEAGRLGYKIAAHSPRWATATL